MPSCLYRELGLWFFAVGGYYSVLRQCVKLLVSLSRLTAKVRSDSDGSVARRFGEASTVVSSLFSSVRTKLRTESNWLTLDSNWLMCYIGWYESQRRAFLCAQWS